MCIRDSNDIATKLKAELKVKIKEVADCKERLKEANSENNKLKSQYKEQAESFEGNMGKRLAEINDLSYQLRSYKIDLDNVTNESKQANQQLILAEKRLEESKEKYNELESYNKKLLKENRNLNTLLNNNSVNLESTAKKLNAATSELNSAQRELDSLSFKYSDLEKTHREYRAHIQEVLSNLNNNLKNFADLHIKDLLTLTENSTELFGRDLHKFAFPKLGEEELSQYPEVMEEWTKALMAFFDALKEKVKELVQENGAVKSRLDSTRKEAVDRRTEKNSEVPVSYTHLTLPTICSV
eukprot:TRINITY_DN15124_c0_g1_i2.p1 TRINITY_DN15124_c0_g1~~TRINITY_DN15124_c0_g1_i2.p1  ORF type:complete len:298 (-),score=86.66 TRINITY_DN15124_c0_g1_i2:40-933(-)